jgi:hypothetical protein
MTTQERAVPGIETIVVFLAGMLAGALAIVLIFVLQK